MIEYAPFLFEKEKNTPFDSVDLYSLLGEKISAPPFIFAGSDNIMIVDNADLLFEISDNGTHIAWLKGAVSMSKWDVLERNNTSTTIGLIVGLVLLILMGLAKSTKGILFIYIFIGLIGFARIITAYQIRVYKSTHRELPR